MTGTRIPDWRLNMSEKLERVNARIPAGLMNRLRDELRIAQGRKRTQKYTLTTLLVQSIRLLLAQRDRNYRASIRRQSKGFEPAPIGDRELMEIVDEENE